MADRKGDKNKQPPECSNNSRCPHIQEVYSDFEGERYDCNICGLYFYLDYEDMK